MDLDNLQNFEISTPEHFGPSSLNHEQYDNLPLAFLNRFEKIGKCCDLSLMLTKKIEDENEFIVVQQKVKKINKQQITVKSKVYQQNKNQQPNRYSNSYPVNSKYNKMRQNYMRNKPVNKTKFKESITVKNNWVQIRDIVKSNFDQEVIKEKDITIQELQEVGVLKELNPNIQKIQRKQYKLDYVDHEPDTKSTLRDQILSNLLIEQLENPSTTKKIYCDSNFLTALMTLKVSQYPWHIKINKQGHVIILDSFNNQESSLSFLDLFCVNENTQNNMPEESKIFENCVKATKVTNSFKKQIASGQILYKAENQDEQEEVSRQTLTRYVKINLEKDLEIYTKVEIDGIKEKIDYDTDQTIQERYLVRALFQTETVYEWKKKFETTAGEVISQEYLANNCNWQKWMIEAYLAGVEKVKAGYISEKQGKFNILNVTQTTKKQIEKNITFKVHECWAVVKYISEAIFKEKDGQYVLLKSPYQSTIKLYFIPEEEEEVQDD